jgi:hypothetical protein
MQNWLYRNSFGAVLTLVVGPILFYFILFLFRDIKPNE